MLMFLFSLLSLLVPFPAFISLFDNAPQTSMVVFVSFLLVVPGRT